MTTAKVQEFAKTAYKAVTWQYRTSTADEATALHDDLATAFADLLARQDAA